MYILCALLLIRDKVKLRKAQGVYCRSYKGFISGVKSRLSAFHLSNFFNGMLIPVMPGMMTSKFCCTLMQLRIEQSQVLSGSV